MSRWIWVILCAILGLDSLICGLLVPAHLRAVDASVLQRAGRNTIGLPERGLALLNEKSLGAAQLLLDAAGQENIPKTEKLAAGARALVADHPDWSVWGGGSYHLAVLFTSDPRLPKSGVEPFTTWVVRQENHETVLRLLQNSTCPAVQELLRCRTLENTVIFSPSQSASGQALDAALSIGGLLLEEQCMASGLSNSVFALASQANNGSSSRPLEEVLLDLMSLGQRLNWGQLAVFMSRVEDAGTLRQLAALARADERKVPVLFAAVDLSGNPGGVAAYLLNFSQTGLKDLGAGLGAHAGGLNELLTRKQRWYSSNFSRNLARAGFISAFTDMAADYCWRTPWLALTVKWLFYLVGGYLLAAAVHFALPAASALERPLQVRGFHVAREILFALGFLLVVLLLNEPFLAQESQRAALPFRLRVPVTGTVAPAGKPGVHPTFMNNSLLTLLLFFVLQALIYTACLVKLAEIRRQKVPPRVKLKLLENEDHLFDAGLYLGFVGTVISLILFSLGVIKFSLMAAYSSTSFGIIFVSFFKIFHLRPVRRKMLLEAEAILPEVEAPAARTRLVVTS
jgi:hypothetical protein